MGAWALGDYEGPQVFLRQSKPIRDLEIRAGLLAKGDDEGARRASRVERVRYQFPEGVEEESAKPFRQALNWVRMKSRHFGRYVCAPETPLCPLDAEESQHRQNLRQPTQSGRRHG